ncbi:hypothetical protein J6590_038649 [Homalodisca vitripennis]|nr:hypothetical protein J6590_038649 [Homalodisca vitripennis]
MQCSSVLLFQYGEDWRIGLEYSLLGVRGLPTREPRTFYSLGLHLHPVTFLLDADLSLIYFLSPNYQTPPPILFPSVRDVHADLCMDPSNNKPKEVKKAAEMVQNSESPGITAQAMLEIREISCLLKGMTMGEIRLGEVCGLHFGELLLHSQQEYPRLPDRLTI